MKLLCRQAGTTLESHWQSLSLYSSRSGPLQAGTSFTENVHNTLHFNTPACTTFLAY
jgi:hypothetical protein